MRFDRVVIVDWSAAGTPTPAAPSKDAIWIGQATKGSSNANYYRTRATACEALRDICATALAAGERLLIGADFAFGYPEGFAAQVTGGDTLSLWQWLADAVEDGAGNANKYREVAVRLNGLFPGEGPFWGNGTKTDLPGLPRLKPQLTGLAEFRETERMARARGLQPKSVWQLSGAGAVGAQALLGIAALERLRRAFPQEVAVWPFEQPDRQIILTEVYPSLLRTEVAARQDLIPDRAQVLTLAEALARMADLAPLFAPPAPATLLREEGWILGVGREETLRQPPVPPRLRDDCFALPAGVNWTPVDEALAHLRARLRPVVGTERIAPTEALGRILAEDVLARRSNPPAANSAVDGYGFAHDATGEGPQLLPLITGRAAAGAPFEGQVPKGAAIRILTGAILPDGVDTVVLEEDTEGDGTRIAFHGPVKPRANTRRAGEDVASGDVLLASGHLIRAPDIALLSATGVAEVAVHRPLRVGVLSTGDEIEADPGRPLTDPSRIYDANRPMLLALMTRWGHVPVDLGHVGDDRALLSARLDQAAAETDVIFTSGGASAGDEDHVSALLQEAGALQTWRVAVKPGRPLALAMWQGVPVFGLPGNPVAAFVCTLIFGRPALAAMSGAGWSTPMTLAVPAAFEKKKKPGRREYLRARLDDAGRAEVFASEGSGRISGLSWATGLVELEDSARHVRPGDLVRFLPYAGFGI